MSDIEKLCTELECNILAKRHYRTGKWDVRVIHSWIADPLLSVQHDTFEEAMWFLNERFDALERQSSFIKKKNEQRRNKQYAHQQESHWEQWI
jgi:hypothetical protein